MRIIESLSRFFPPITRGVKVLLIANFGVFALAALLQAMYSGFSARMFHMCGLVPSAVLHGQIWQLLTYAFLHAGFSHVFWNMFGLWMFGSMLEQDWGYRKFMEFYLFSAMGAAVLTTLASFTRLFGLSPDMPIIGASGGVFGILMGAAILHGRQTVLLYFIIPIQLRILVLIYGIAQFMGITSGDQSIAYVTHLGGMAAGFLYIRFISPARNFSRSRRAYGVQQTIWRACQRWRLQRRHRQFIVYMRKHDPNYRFSGDLKDE